MSELKQEIEEYVDDWHFDEETKVFAFEMGKFLFAFMDFLKEKGLSDRVIRTHGGNIGLIGHFEAGYGFHDEFEPEILEDGPHYEYEFKRKVSDSKYAIQSYNSTWRKLDKFIKSKEYEKYLERIEDSLK
jgi:hypothetical protein